MLCCLFVARLLLSQVYHQLLILNQKCGFSTFLLMDERTTHIHTRRGQLGNGQQMLTLLFNLLQVDSIVAMLHRELSKHFHFI